MILAGNCALGCRGIGLLGIAANLLGVDGLGVAIGPDGRPGKKGVIYGDYYFLEAMTRLEVMKARDLLGAIQQVERVGGNLRLEFERHDPAPALAFRIQESTDLIHWTTIAAKTGGGPWSGDVEEVPCPGGKKRVRVEDPAPALRGFIRVVTRALDGSAP